MTLLDAARALLMEARYMSPLDLPGALDRLRDAVAAKEARIFAGMPDPEIKLHLVPSEVPGQEVVTYRPPVGASVVPVDICSWELYSDTDPITRVEVDGRCGYTPDGSHVFATMDFPTPLALAFGYLQQRTVRKVSH